MTRKKSVCAKYRWKNLNIFNLQSFESTDVEPMDMED
jgi:hypothetical protein